MTGLFLPRLRVVSLLHPQHLFSAAGRNRLMRPIAFSCRNELSALIRNNEQDGGGDVSTRL
jgi:hypothetical protein